MLPLDTPIVLVYDEATGYVRHQEMHLLPRVVERHGSQLRVRATEAHEVQEAFHLTAACGITGWLYLYNGIVLDYADTSLCPQCEALNPHLKEPRWNTSTVADFG